VLRDLKPEDLQPAVAHQAAGMIAAQRDCTIDQAFAVLLRFARDCGETSEDVSRQVIGRTLRFD
jgi:hypothetical protein